MAGLIGFGIDQIKEKIKKNEEARQSGLVIDSLEARIADSAKDKSPEELEGFSKAFDALRKAKLTTTETLAVAKTLAPDMFSEMGSLGAMPAVVFDPDTGCAVDWGSDNVDIPSRLATKLIGEIFVINGWIDAPSEGAEKN